MPSLAVAALLTTGHHGTKVAERHAERLALLSLFGVRPAELKNGVEVLVVTDPRTGGQFLAARVEGVKVNAERGQAQRTLVVPVDNAAARGRAQAANAQGGSVVVTTTDADHRSLNRALKRSGLSCYSFRHSVASELKRQAIARPETAATAATFMGHTSTKSLTSYGRAQHARGGRKFGARAERQVRRVPVTRAQKTAAREATRVTDASASITRIPNRGALARRIPTPGLKIPSGPKPPRMR